MKHRLVKRCASAIDEGLIDMELPRQWESKLDELLDRESGLTPWEIDFIESLDGRRGYLLSEKQEDTLNRIWERLCNS